MQFVPAKTILSKNKSTMWFGADYTINIYRGCHHGCIYCDSRSSCYRVENFDEVRAKENSIEILAKELKSKRKKGVIGTGAMSDPYNKFEEKFGLTRQSLELIRDNKFGVMLNTKSDLIARDAKLIAEISAQAPALVGVSITTVLDSLAKKIERNVSVSSKRFAAIGKLREENVYAGVIMTPMLPFITDNEKNIVNMVKEAKLNDAQFVYPMFGVTMRDNQRDHYYEWLDRLSPGMKEKYQKRYGEQYYCDSPSSKKLSKLFTEVCDYYQMTYKMEDIIANYKYDFEV